jgi:cation/acetate symporter
VNPLTVGIFLAFVTSTLVLSWFLGRRARSAEGYFAAHGQVHWFVNGFAFAGDYLSAASFLGICGMIAFYGYDGFLYSIGYLAGWVVALFVVAEPLKRMGRFTFADALDRRFNSRGIKLAGAISTLVVSIFYLIPQMVGAGALIKPLLGFPHHVGVLLVGVVVTLIVVSAGMVSTTWVQFVKGTLLVGFCALLTGMILIRGFTVEPQAVGYSTETELSQRSDLQERLAPEGVWATAPYLRVRNARGEIEYWRTNQVTGPKHLSRAWTLTELKAIGHVAELPEGQTATGPLGPMQFFRTLEQSTVILWTREKVGDTTLFYPTPTKGADVLRPGYSPTFSGLRQDGFTWAKVDFLSLMLALFCGTASLPHILIRYYTVKSQAAVRKSTVVGIASIGAFYVLTLYLGLGAMTCGNLNPSDSNMAAPLLARSFSEVLFALISAIAFTTVLGTVSGLIMAASGAVAHDLVANFMGVQMNDIEKVRLAKLAAVAVGAVAMVLGILFQSLNVSFLVGWAFNVAASANLPALLMSLFWRRATHQGIMASILVGLFSSLGWILLSGDTFSKVYGLSATQAPVPFSQPAIVTIPLAFLVLVLVSLWTRSPAVGAEGSA